MKRLIVQHYTFMLAANLAQEWASCWDFLNSAAREKMLNYILENKLKHTQIIWME